MLEFDLPTQEPCSTLYHDLAFGGKVFECKLSKGHSGDHNSVEAKQRQLPAGIQDEQPTAEKFNSFMNGLIKDAGLIEEK